MADLVAGGARVQDCLSGQAKKKPFHLLEGDVCWPPLRARFPSGTRRKCKQTQIRVGAALRGRHEGASQAVTRRLCSSRSSSVPSAGFCLWHSVQSCTRLLAQLQQKRCVASVFCAEQMGRDLLPPFPGTDSCLGAAQLAVTFQALSQAGVLLGVSRLH